MPEKRLVDFINEARKRGFGDLEIRNSLLNHKWPSAEIEKAFAYLAPKFKFKNQVTLFLDNELLKLIEKRAKKNMFTISEQIEDILRRSVISQKNQKSIYDEKLDDTLVSIFSRRNTGRRSKK
ncbi:MAG: hypothetical protein NTU63_03550 [Candidatus Pacearchaeota archaeon]|nr:hypothetical protein [Candidatus Pacearchaeota archaeon]